MESPVPPAFCPLSFWHTLELGQGEAGRGPGMSLWVPWRAWLLLNPHTFTAANRFWNESDLPWHSVLAQLHCGYLAYFSHHPEPESLWSSNWDGSNYPLIYRFNLFSNSPLLARKQTFSTTPCPHIPRIQLSTSQRGPYPHDTV